MTLSEEKHTPAAAAPPEATKSEGGSLVVMVDEGSNVEDEIVFQYDTTTPKAGEGIDVENGKKSANDQSKSNVSKKKESNSDDDDDDDDDDDNPPLFTILVVFFVASMIVTAFDAAGSLENINMDTTLALGFASIPLICCVLICITEHNKKKRITKSSHAADSKDHHKNSSPDCRSREEKALSASKGAATNPKKTYPEDIYSFLALYHPIRDAKFFSFGFVVFLFQMSLLVLMALNVIVPRLRTTGEVDNTESGNWLGTEIFPSKSGYLVKATQIVSIMAFIFFPEESLLDITTAVELFPGFGHSDPDKRLKLNGLRWSCAFRFLQGMLSTLSVWLLVMTSSDVVDIVLNFTAINFISSLDNRAFELAKLGKYGRPIRKAASKINDTPLPPCVEEHSEHERHKGGIIITCFVLYAITIGVMITQGNTQTWVTPEFRVQFQDETRSTFSGCYRINENVILDQRFVYESANVNIDQSKIGFCHDKRRWIIFEGDGMTPCKALGTENEIAHSAKTDTFDIQSSISEDWYSSFNTPIDDMYFTQFDETDNVTAICNSLLGNGICDGPMNNFDYEYDGGDCCYDTCKGFLCGKPKGYEKEIGCEEVKAIGCDLPEVEYPNCVPVRSAYTPLTILIEEPDNSLDFLSLTCNDIPVFRIKTGEVESRNSMVSAMVQYGSDCVFFSEYLDSNLDDRTVPKFSVHHGWYTTGLQELPGYRGTSFLHSENSSSFTVQHPVYTKENIFSWEGFGQPRELDFSGLNIVGTISSKIGMLTSLTALDLSSNKFTGTIPSEIGKLTLLRSLKLGANQLSGTIPTEIGLLDVYEVFLTGNRLTGTIPTEIGNLDAIISLSLAHNRLNGTIATQITSLKNLERLWLDHNQLSGNIVFPNYNRPIDWSKFTSNTIVDLSTNKLTGTIPTDIGKMTWLDFFNLTANQVTGTIPTELGLHNLKFLWLSYNRLRGTVPANVIREDVYYEIWAGNNLDGSLDENNLDGDDDAILAFYGRYDDDVDDDDAFWYGSY